MQHPLAKALMGFMQPQGRPDIVNVAAGERPVKSPSWIANDRRRALLNAAGPRASVLPLDPRIIAAINARAQAGNSLKRMQPNGTWVY